MDKETLTQQILNKAVNYDLMIGYEKALKEWWWPVSSHRPGHMRLTKAGFDVLTTLVKPYKFEYAFHNSPMQLKMLSKMPVAYYVDYSGYIQIFSKDLASMIALYNNFDRYLELIQND